MPSGVKVSHYSCSMRYYGREVDDLEPDNATVFEELLQNRGDGVL